MKILFIFRDPVIKKFYARALEDAGYEVVARAKPPAGGISAILQLGPKLIVYELAHPVMSGAEFVKLARKQAALLRTPILGLSAEGKPEEISRAITAGMTECINLAQCIPSVFVKRVGGLIGPGEDARNFPTLRSTWELNRKKSGWFLIVLAILVPWVVLFFNDFFQRLVRSVNRGWMSRPKKILPLYGTAIGVLILRDWQLILDELFWVLVSMAGPLIFFAVIKLFSIDLDEMVTYTYRKIKRSIPEPLAIIVFVIYIITSIWNFFAAILAIIIMGLSPFFMVFDFSVYGRIVIYIAGYLMLAVRWFEEKRIYYSNNQGET